MKKKIFLSCMVFACIVGVFSTLYANNIKNGNISEDVMANVEALTNDEKEPEWWDFFNNYIVQERIPINTSTCRGGILTYKGISISIGSCTNYSYAVIGHCYDGGNRDECTSSKVLYYI